MIHLTKRQKEILVLLSESKDPITAEWIAKELDVSDRTVRNDIKVIQKDCSYFGAKLESIRGKGYRLIVENEALFSSSFPVISKESEDISGDFADQNNRVNYMLKRLLLEKGFIKLESFTDEMFVSMSTIQNDLKILKEILEKYQLKLTNRPHYGTRVEGDEYMKRLCLSNTILNREQDVTINQEDFQLLNPQLFNKVKEILVRKINQYKIEISDISLENLATHITIACKRIKEGFYINSFDDFSIDQYPFEKIVATDIIKEVEEFTDLKFPDAEMDYIIVHLLGTKLLHKKELVEFSEYDDVGTIVNCILEKLKKELNWDFSGDMEFIQALTLHIRPAMNRMRYKMNIRNPLLNEIKYKYPSAFEGAIIASKCIEHYLDTEVIEDEIGYIALHIGVALERMRAKSKKEMRVLIVCASGVGSAKLLHYRLENVFGREIEIVDTINYYNLASYDLYSVDFIISTIPIKEDLGIPVVVVNTFLEANDINEIREHLSKTTQKVENYLHPSRIFLQKDFSDKGSVLAFLCDELYNQGLVSDNYLELVMERESIAPTSFGNLVAVPHPILPITSHTFWAICTLKKPIEWHEHTMVQFVCLLNIKKDPRGDFERMYQKLISVIDNKSMVQKLIESKTPEELLELLKNFKK